MTTAALSPRHQHLAHLTEKLQRELSPAIGQWLVDDDVIEIMANPNGELWVDRLSIGMERTGVRLPESQIEMAIGTVAAMHELVINASAPRLKAELPLDGSRFQGLIRPISPPTFVIRKHLKRVIPLDEHVAQGTLSAWQATVLREALRTRRNLIIVGATLSGKTVLANSLLDAMLALYGETVRLVLIEDTYELLCTAPNVTHLHTCDAADLRTLVQDTLRLRPDRIIVGEVRGAEALDLVKAWNTGHPGGITTVHADTAAAALVRLESLIEEADVRPNPRVIATACHLLVMMERSGSQQWQVREMVRCEGWDGRRYVLTPIPAEGPDDDKPPGPGGASGWLQSRAPPGPSPTDDARLMKRGQRRRTTMQRWRYGLSTVAVWSLLRASSAWALTGTGLPWDQPFTVFTEGLLGSPAHAGVALAILLTGLMWANTHHQPGIVKGTATVAGGAVAIKALDIMNVFGWGGALC